ncbi:fatty acid desaturase [Roseovarius aestuarii]|nr:fatty acid desaturase [Roseovarius aestuarii]
MAGLVYVFAVVVIGTRLRSFGNIVHECSHAGFVEDRSWNDAIGRLLSTLLCYSYDCYRDGHKTHHLYTGDYEKDEDFADTKAYEFHQPLSVETIKRHLFRLITFQFFPFYTGKTVFTTEDRPTWLVLRLLYVMFVMYGLLGIWNGWFGSDMIVWYWVVPYVTVLPIIAYLSDLFDHAGLIGNENEIDKSRNYPVKSRALHWLFFPRHDSYHLVHHLFPMVPTKHLADCHEILMAESQYYASRPHSFRGWLSNVFFQTPELSGEYQGLK